MATGDNADIISRLQRWLPTGWFPTDSGTRIYALLSGFAAALKVIWDQIAYTRKQTRVATTTDGFLELASYDFFGPALPRLTNEPDAAYSLRIRNEVLRDRITKSAIDALLYEMTGQHPVILELETPEDTGGYRYWMGYGVAGAYASRAWRFSVFIQTTHAGQFSIPNVGGFRGYLAGFRAFSFMLADPSMLTGTGFSDAQIYAALDKIRAAGVTYWVKIS